MSATITVAAGAFAVRVGRRPVVAGAALLLLLLAGMLAALCLGEYPVAVPKAVAAVLGGGDAADRLIVGQLRLPRVLCGALAGIALGAAGALFQAVSRNPLGSPDVLGFDSGASSGALVAILLLHAGAIPTALGAVAGGTATALLVFGLTARDGGAPLRLVLIGLGVGSMLAAVNSLLVVRAQVYDAQSAAAWLIGSLAGSSWAGVAILASVALAVLLLGPALGRALSIVELSDECATSLGARPPAVRLAAVGLGVLLASAAVATAGPIPFVALAAPQIARRLTRAAGPHLITGGLTGGVLLVLADLAAREAFQPRQYPVGVVTGIIGGGYLAWLLGREWKAGRA